MRLRLSPVWLLPLLLLCGVGAWWFLSGKTPEAERWTVSPSRFEKWTPLAGTLEAAQAVSLRAELDGLSKITWLIPDGTPVEAGEAVARFDPSELEEKKLHLARDLNIARAEVRALTLAEHPLELQRLQNEGRKLEAALAEERVLRADTAELVEENLLTEGELKRYDLKIRELEAENAALREQIRLTREVLHPSAAQQAQARLNAADTALAAVEARLEKTEVKAPVQGTVYLPRIPIDGERRPPRVGDGLFRNQVFMQVADLTELEVVSRIPEQFLSRIVPGLEARIHFPAFPGQPHRATVSRVGSHPEGERRHYPLWLRLHDSAPSLRPGLTAEIEVLELVLEEALLIPRSWVLYRNGTPAVRMRTRRGEVETRQVTLGDGTADSVVVREGLRAGDVLLQP